MVFADYLLVAAKTAGFFALALTVFRLMGKRTLGDLEPLDFVVVLAIAEIVGAPLADPGAPVLPAVVAVLTLASLHIGLAYTVLRSRRAAELLEGKPLPVVEGGRVLRHNLRRAKMTEEELRERLRQKGFLDPADVELALLETDGMLSALPRPEVTPVTPRYLGRESSTVVALMGRPVEDGLREAGLSAAELRRRLRSQGVRLRDTEEVLIGPDGRLHLTLAPRSAPARRGTRRGRDLRRRRASLRPGGRKRRGRREP